MTLSSNISVIQPLWTPAELDTLLENALREDLLGGDVTSWALIPEPQEATAKAYAKEKLVVCGLSIAQRVFSLLDPKIYFKAHVNEGQFLEKGDCLFEVTGEIHSILAAERLALNLLQQMSGIATIARRYVEAVEGKVKVVDTRKTLPGLRALQRYAVRVGGAANHRYHLGSGILIKENHIRAAGSVHNAVKRAQANAPHSLRVEIEVTNFDELREALDAGAEVIMLDNMTPSQLVEAVAITKGRAILEASGGITLETIGEYAKTGVDIISVGALTHSVKAADITLLIDEK